MRELSARQREILDFLDSYASAHGMAPSLSEIAANFGIAPATVSGHLRALQKKRRLNRSPKARSIVLTKRDAPEPVLKIPVYGRLVSPDMEENNTYWEGVTCLHRSATGTLSAGRLFALRIPDESLRELGIFRGDTAIFAPADERPPHLGDVAAVLIGDGSVTVRGYFPHGNTGTVTLRAAHPNIPALDVRPGEARIIGVLISLQRNYQR